MQATAVTTHVMDQQSVMITLLQLLKSERFCDLKTRYALAWAIGCMGPEVAPYLLEALSDPSDAVRQCASTALRIISRKSPTSTGFFKKGLEHSDEKVRLATAIAMLQSPCSSNHSG